MRLEYHNHGGDDKERRTKVTKIVFLNNFLLDPSLKMSPSLVSQIHNVTITGLSSLYITMNPYKKQPNVASENNLGL